MIQIVIVGNQIYSSLSLLVRQSMLMFATALEGGRYEVFDSQARDMYGNSHSEGICVLLEIKSMHK